VERKKKVNQIKFSHNWNGKLNHTVFTTIRKWSAGKHNYYARKMEEDFQVILNDTTVCIATLISTNVARYDDIHFGLLAVDTGFSVRKQINNLFERFGIRAKDMCLILTFCKNE
jgi:hypothetical protein